MKGTHPSPGGMVHTTVDGKWLFAGGELMFQYTLPHHPQATIKYPAKLDGNKLTLDNGRTKVAYTRSK